MKLKEIIFATIVAVVVTVLFFYKTFLFHQIPFPGDLLVSENPYKTQSYLGYAPGGYPNIAQGMDVITEILPWKIFSISQLKQGQLPFWNPYNFSGNFLMQNFQSAVFYPLNCVFFLLSFSFAWSLFIMLQPFLAVIFMYVFLRHLGLMKPISLIGGIAFAFSSYMTVWIEYGNIDNTLVWLPLVLFAIDTFMENQTVRYFLLAVFSLTMSLFAGYIQGVFYMYIISISYLCFLLFQKIQITRQSRLSESLKIRISDSQAFHSTLKKNFRLLFSFLLIFLLPVCLTAFQLLPTFSAFQQSTRSNYSLSQIQNLLQPLYYWVTLFAPDFFGNPAHRNFFLPITYIERVMYFGVPLLLFSMYALVKVKSHIMLFFLTMAILILLLTTNLPFIQYLYLLPIPMISTTVPTRALSIFIFSMIIVGCYGIDYWALQKKSYKTIVPFVFLCLYALIWIAVFILAKTLPLVSNNKSVMIHNFVVPTAIAVFTVLIFYSRRMKSLYIFSLLALCCLIIGDLFVNFQKITPFAPASLMYPQTSVVSYVQKEAGINRFWGYGPGYILPNFQTVDRTYSPEGNDPLHNKDYGLLLASSKDGNYPDLLPRPDANIAQGYGSSGMQNPYRQKILDLLGVKYILYQDSNLPPTLQPRYDTFPEKNYHLVWQQDSWQVYENMSALPRFFLTSNYIVEPDMQHALRAVYHVNAKTLVLHQRPAGSPSPKTKGTVSLISYAPNTVKLRTQTTGDTLLFLSDGYSPSWQATIDSVKTPVYQADVAFRAIVVPAGNHLITFQYVPQFFTLGLTIAGISVVFLICYSWYLFKYER